MSKILIKKYYWSNCYIADSDLQTFDLIYFTTLSWSSFQIPRILTILTMHKIRYVEYKAYKV